MSASLPYIIVNPKSGRGLSERRWASYASVIRQNLGPFDCEFTRAPGHAIAIAEQQAAAGRDLIVAYGGDGTASEIANGILRAESKSTALGLLPGGSGSDFRRTLKIPRDLAQAAKQLRDGQDHWMDAGRIAYIDHNGAGHQRFFVNTASFGMSGAVASRANRSGKFLGGTLTYATATIRTILSFNTPEILLDVDSQPTSRLKAIIVCVANGPSFGGGMRIAPDARLDDGMFDVVIAGDIKAFTLLTRSHRLYSGSHLSMDKIALLRGQRIHAAAMDDKQEVLLEVDGETPGRLPATIEILPKALKIRC